MDFPLNKWKNMLCLQDWHIELCYTDTLENNHWGVVSWQSVDRLARITISSDIPEDMRYFTAVHELVHLAGFEMQDIMIHFKELLTDSREINMISSLWRSATEVTVNRLTKALLEAEGIAFSPVGLDCQSIQQAGCSGLLVSSPLHLVQSTKS